MGERGGGEGGGREGTVWLRHYGRGVGEVEWRRDVELRGSMMAIEQVGGFLWSTKC
jgi:hypothetical protein